MLPSVLLGNLLRRATTCNIVQKQEYGTLTTKDAYGHCRRIAAEHYENFPVASSLAPRALRPHIAAVYAFARHADDIVDEGSAPASRRRAELEEWRSQLERGLSGAGAEDPVFIALADTASMFDVPHQLFHDLLDAFAQDTEQQVYGDFDELLRYCRRSADPVGRIVLALFGLLDERRAPFSDALCTGLQLTNFWQDVSVDRLKPRVYIPAEDLDRFGLGVEDILHGQDTDSTRALLRFQVQRSREFFREALPLLSMVPLRLRLELRAIWLGGWTVLDKIEELQYNALTRRPELHRTDVLRILARTVFSTISERPAHG